MNILNKVWPDSIWRGIRPHRLSMWVRGLPVLDKRLNLSRVKRKQLGDRLVLVLVEIIDLGVA